MRQLAANRRRLLQEVVFFRENALEENVRKNSAIVCEPPGGMLIGNGKTARRAASDQRRIGGPG